MVIDNFLHKADNASLLYDNIAKWATLLTEANVAHVIFLTNDVGYTKALATDRVLRVVTLSDKDPEAARVYVLQQLDYIESEKRKQRGERDSSGQKPPSRTLNLDNSIRVLGGRMKDLEGLAQRLAMGVAPDGPLPIPFCRLSKVDSRRIKRYNRAICLGNSQIIFPRRFISNKMDSRTSLDAR